MDALKPTEPSISNGHEVTTAVAAMKSQAEVPLPPTASAAIPEDSIARLEVVTSAVPCESWTSNGPTTPSAVAGPAASAEPVDCISKLQAVAVPSDPWGSIATRSTLATTLLSADELDDDDDDFEDDYEEEESIIPTYCPMRYHPFVPHPHPHSHQLPSHPHQQQPQQLSQQQPHPQQQQLAQQQQQHPQQQRSYAPGYGSRQPNYYSEPFPQQNCSRTGGPQHMTQSPPTPQQARGFAPPQWATAGSSPANPSSGAQQFYEPTNGGAYARQRRPSRQFVVQRTANPIWTWAAAVAHPEMLEDRPSVRRPHQRLLFHSPACLSMACLLNGAAMDDLVAGAVPTGVATRTRA